MRDFFSSPQKYDLIRLNLMAFYFDLQGLVHDIKSFRCMSMKDRCFYGSKLRLKFLIETNR